MDGLGIGSVVTLSDPDTVWDGKTGVLKGIDESTGIALVYVDFLPEKGKKVLQYFEIEKLAPAE